MNDFNGLYNIREAKDTDKNFVLATFLRGLYYGESFFSRVPKDIFMTAYKRVAQALVNDKNTKILVACLPEDQDVILGYSMLSRDDKTVYFTFVKTTWRKRGIARSLVPKDAAYVAHLTKLGDILMPKLTPNAKLNPFFLVMGRFKTSEERLRKKAMKSAIKQLSKGRPMPRQLKEINDEYSMACAKLGALTYQVSVHEQEKATLLEKIKNLNIEASERNKLDKEAAKVPAETGAADVQA